MTRAEVIMRYLAHKAAAKALHDALTADARAEYEEHQTAPTWRLPFATAPAAIEQDGVEVVDEQALLTYIGQRFPTEVVMVRQVRNPNWLGALLDAAAQRGIDLALQIEEEMEDAGGVAPQIQILDVDGSVIPGVQFRPGGAFKSVSVRPTDSAARRLRRMAARYASGEGPLEIEGLRIDD